MKVGDVIEIRFGAKTLRAEVLSVQETVKRTMPPQCTANCDKKTHSLFRQRMRFAFWGFLFLIPGVRLRYAEHAESLAVDLVGFENDGE